MSFRGLNKYLLFKEHDEDGTSSGGGKEPDPNPSDEGREEKVDINAYKQTKNDMHKFKRESLELKDKVSSLMNEIKSMKDKQLESSENYKELWEQEKGLRSDWENKFKGLNETIRENHRISAVKEQAVKSGLDPDFMDMLDAFDMSEVIVEKTDSGRFSVSGADTFIESLKSAKPKMFTKQSKDPSINNKGGSYQGGEKTYTTSELLKLEKENPDKYREIITKKRHLIVRK